MNKIFIIETVADKLLEKNQDRVSLYGRTLHGEGIFHVLDLGNSNMDLIGWYFPSIGNKDKFRGSILLTRGSNNQLVGHIKKNNKRLKADIEVIRINSDIFSRTKGILDSKQLLDKKVMCIGLGSVGSIMVSELCKSGVGRFHLVDNDRMGSSNISRHLCDLRDLGRYKTLAVKDKLENINPLVNVSTYQSDILDLIGNSEFTEMVKDLDLIISVTDKVSIQLILNKIALESNVPFISAGIYERAFGGDIIYVIPEWKTPCYECIVGEISEDMDFPKNEAIIDYSSITDPNDLKAEPGLSVDINYIVMAASKISLALILKDDKENEINKILTKDRNILFIGNKEKWIFSGPFQAISGDTKIRDDCSCQRKSNLVNKNNVLKNREFNNLNDNKEVKNAV